MVSSWQTLKLGGGARVASKLDLRRLVRPLYVVGPEIFVSQVCEALAQGAVPVLAIDGPELVGTTDAAALRELGLSDTVGSTPTLGMGARQTCTILPVAAVTTNLIDQEAANVMKRVQEVSRQLVLVEAGSPAGAVPTDTR